jgi:uncharacterized membrane protein
LRALDIAATAINGGLYAALGVIFYYVLPITAPGIGTVRFWPPVIVPAVFAALFGPWVGSVGAMMGIFVSDMLIHGNPVLSLMAGVTSNFAGFFLVGYLAKGNTQWKIPLAFFGLVSALLIAVTQFVLVPQALLSQVEGLVFSVVIVASYVVLSIVALSSEKWRSYEVGCMVGLLIGAAIIGLMVPVFSQIFIMPGQTLLTPLAVSAGLWYLVWTFATEILFMIVLGPPILEACYRAFPTLKSSRKE